MSSRKNYARPCSRRPLKWMARKVQRGFHHGHALHLHDVRVSARNGGRMCCSAIPTVSRRNCSPFAPRALVFAPAPDAATPLSDLAKNDPLAELPHLSHQCRGDIVTASAVQRLRVGYQVGSLNTKLRLGTPQIPAVAGRVGQSRLRYLLDHTDDPVIPRSGFSANEFRWSTKPAAKVGFPSMDLKLGYFQPHCAVRVAFSWRAKAAHVRQHQHGSSSILPRRPVRSAPTAERVSGQSVLFISRRILRDLLIFLPFWARRFMPSEPTRSEKCTVSLLHRAPDDVAAGFLAETPSAPSSSVAASADSGIAMVLPLAACSKPAFRVMGQFSISAFLSGPNRLCGSAASPLCCFPFDSSYAFDLVRQHLRKSGYRMMIGVARKTAMTNVPQSNCDFGVLQAQLSPYAGNNRIPTSTVAQASSNRSLPIIRLTTA